MCGRAAQSVGSVSVSATSLGITPSLGHIDGANGTCNNNRDQGSSMTEDPSDQWRDNYNLSPGMDAMVFVKDDITGSLEMKRMIWGLVTKPGGCEALQRNVHSFWWNLPAYLQLTPLIYWTASRHREEPVTARR